MMKKRKVEIRLTDFPGLFAELIDKCVGSRIWVVMKGEKGMVFLLFSLLLFILFIELFLWILAENESSLVQRGLKR